MRVNFCKKDSSQCTYKTSEGKSRVGEVSILISVFPKWHRQLLFDGHVRVRRVSGRLLFKTRTRKEEVVERG